MNLSLSWVPQVSPRFPTPPAAVVGPTGYSAAEEARKQGLIPADTPDADLAQVYADYLAGQVTGDLDGAVEAATNAKNEAEEFAAASGASQSAAGASATAAATDAARAELAAQQVITMSSGQPFDTIAAGLAATTPNQTFAVFGPDNLTAISIYRHLANGTAEFVTAYNSLAAFEQARADIDALGDGDGWEIRDGRGRLVLSIDALGRSLLADMVFGRDSGRGFRVADKVGRIGGPVTDSLGRTGVGDYLFGRDVHGAIRVADRAGRLSGIISLANGDVRIGGRTLARDSSGGERTADAVGRIGGVVVRRDSSVAIGDMTFARDSSGKARRADKVGRVAGPIVQRDGSTQIADILFRNGDSRGLKIADRFGRVGLSLKPDGLRVMGQRVGRRGLWLPPGPLMRKLAYSRAGVEQGLRPGRGAFIGDSHFDGTDSGGDGVKLRELSTPTAFTRMLRRSIGAASYSSFFGTTGLATAADFNTYFPSVSLGAGWIPGATINKSLGEFWQNSSSTNPISLSPNVGRQWDTAEIYVYADTSVTLRLANGAQSYDFTPATLQIVKITQSFAAATDALQISRVTGGTLRILGAAIYNSANPEMAVFNVSRGGWTTADWSTETNVFSPLPALKALAPDWAFVQLGINDQTINTPISTFKANYQKIIDGLASVGTDLSLIVPPPTDRASTIPWGSYVSATYDLAYLNSLPLIDLTDRYGSAQKITNGGFRADGLHENGFGQGDEAVPIHNFYMTI